MSRTFQLFITLVSIGTLAPVQAQRNLKDIPPPDSELERKTFQIPEGFEVNLFAADPRIAKPIQMNFDEQGRLWIVSSEVYPHIEPGAEAKDRVLVVEDTDHDGVSDKTHVFAGGLLIPTGIAPGDGGVYVANSTQLLHFADTDGDLKADSKRIVLSGFGTEDTHHILHTLRWGYDGYLYFNQSIYIHSHVETPWGVRRLNAGGIWQFRPETLELGVFMRGLVNSWGHHYDRFGQSFATDGAGGEGINYIVPGAYYFTAANAQKILHGLNPGSPKHCGLEIVETPMLPPDWQGCAITNDFRGHRVCRFQLTEDRSGFVSREQKEVIKSDHVAFRPIDVKLGPDGAIYIADWYNPIIQHGEVDFRDPRRDHTHGRIWRLTWKGAPKREFKDVTTMKNTELFAELTGNDKFYRQAARQVLRQRGEEVVEDLNAWTTSLTKTPETEPARLQALWCYQSLRQVNRDLLSQLLQADDARVRAAAVRVLSHWKHALTDDAGEWFRRAALDEHPRVRLEAVRGVAYSPNSESELMTAQTEAPDKTELLASRAQNPKRIETAMLVTDQQTDRFIDYAVWLTARDLADSWIPAFQSGDVDFDGNVSHLLAAFAAVGQGAPVDTLLKQMYARETTATQRSQVIDLVTSTGNPAQLKALVLAAISNNDAAPIRRALAESRRRKLVIPVSGAELDPARKSESTTLRAAALVAQGQWKLNGYLRELFEIVLSSEAPLSDRMAAMEGLFFSGDVNIDQRLVGVARGSEHPMALRKHAAALIAGRKPRLGAKVVVELFPQMKADDGPQDLVRTFMIVKGGDAILAESLNGADLRSDVAREMLRVVRESGRAAPTLEAALRTAGKITSRKSLSKQQRDALLELSRTAVTAKQGEAVFRNPRLGCLKCHAIGGAGGKVGPDMVSLGGSAQPDYLLESLLDPNAKVKENYHTIVIATDEGKLISGVQIRQSKSEVVVRNAEDRVITVPRSEIEEIAQGVSLMPEGQVDTLTDEEVAAMVRFLSELGRTPEYSIGRRQLARTWDVLQPTTEAAFRLRRTSYATAAADDPAFTWQKSISTVAGNLPLSDIPQVMVKNRSAAGSRGVGFARCYIEAETAGEIVLSINGFEGLELRHGQNPVDLVSTIKLSVQPGKQRLTFTVDQSIRTKPLEVEILTKGTTAVAKFVND